MIKILDSTADDVLAALRGRSMHRDDETEETVKTIIADVRQRGDAALLDNARKFDAPGLESIKVDEADIEFAKANATLEAAVAEAIDRITWFHVRQLTNSGFDWEFSHISGKFDPNEWIYDAVHSHVQLSGTWNADTLRWNSTSIPGQIYQRALSLDSAGVYVPGGNAAYPSSVLMNVIPAKVAGVKRVAITTPARRDGSLDPAVLYAIEELLHFEVFKIGGAAAIAALALGTESVPRVDKIVGPGNRFVNEAKRQLWGQVGLDGYAGPSEVCVLADDEANEEFAAADLLTQVEHAPDNAGFLVCLSRPKLDAILAAVERQLTGAPREATMRAALTGGSLAIVARDLDEAIEIVNAIAPEHLTLAVKEPERAMEKVRNAGAILLGEYTPESAGDYCLGPSHTLPTSGAARWQSPVNVMDFIKLQSVARLSREELQPLIPTIEALAEVEGFPAHGFGATVRRDK